MTTSPSPDDRRLLDWMARDLLRAAGQTAPPYDIDALAAHLGVLVEEDWDDDSAQLFAYSGVDGQEHLHLVVEQAPPGVFVFDDDGHRLIRRFGSEGEVIGG